MILSPQAPATRIRAGFMARRVMCGLGFLLLSVSVGLAANAVSDFSERDFRGLPYYQFFGPKDFDSSASSRFIEVSNDGSFFYADQNWIFLYDGAYWRKLYFNGDGAPLITSMRWSPDGTVYAGSYNAIGTVAIDAHNRIAFQPLVEEQVSTEAGEHFGAIQLSDTHIYFEGKRTVAIYEKATGEARIETFNTWITASWFHQGTYYVATDFHQIYRDLGDHFELDEELTRDTAGITIADAVALPDGDIAMGSERNGMYRFDGASIQRAYPNFTDYKEHLFSDLTVTPDGRLIAAVMGLGVVTLDEEGNILELFGGKKDYRFKSARAVLTDRSGTVWAMFNSSVAKILVDSPLTAIDERLRPSLFYASPHALGDNLYLRNFYVLYKAEFDERNRLSGFVNALPDSNLKVWVVEDTPEALYLGTDGDGIYRFNGEILTRLGDAPAYDRLHQAEQDPTLFVAANSRQFALYREAGDRFEKIDEVANPHGFVNRLAEDGNGDFWAEYGLGSAGRLRVRDGKLTLDYFDASNGLPTQEWMTLWIHEGRAYFTCPQGAMALDADRNVFEIRDVFGDSIPRSDPRISRAITDPKGNIWLSADGANSILWKQPDGSYVQDRSALSEMGEPYFEFITFFGEDHQAIIVTSFELFHYRPNESPTAKFTAIEPTRINRISDVDGSRAFFAALGNANAPAPQILPFQSNSLRFQVSNSYSLTTLPMEFQYYLRGFSSGSAPSETSPWSTSSETYFTNLGAGAYTFMARARLGNGIVTPWTEYSFKVAPPFYRTYWAYGVYVLLLIGLIQICVRIYLRQLMRRNLRLKTMVEERTREIEQKNGELERQAEELASKNIELATQSEEIQRNARDLAGALSELRSTQDQLLVTARKAGMSEVATNVLHNVGNVLNSVNVSLNSLSKRLSGSRINGLRRLADLVAQHRDGLAEFLLENPKGRTVPDYLIQLAQVIEEEFKLYQSEVEQMGDNVDHIKRIIATQQSHARSGEVKERFDMGELLESAFTITLGSKRSASYAVTTDIHGDLSVKSDKHKILQILINLIKNADEAIREADRPSGELRIACAPSIDDSSVIVEVADNGVGIRPDDKNRLFSHGFTTKWQGNGFGLHASAIDIKTLGGDLRLSSDGPGLGAKATLTIPRQASRRTVLREEPPIDIAANGKN